MRIRILHIVPLFLVFFGLSSCHKSWRVQSYETGYYKMNMASQDSSILALIQPYHDSLSEEMGLELANLDRRLTKQKPNGLLGFYTCDALRAGAAFISKKSIDISVLNNGGIRRPYLGPGAVTIGDIYELMPFDNRVMLLELDSSQIYALGSFVISKGGDPISGMKIYSDSILRIEVNGLPLKSKSYTLVCTDYQYNGGDGYGFLQKSNILSADLGLLRDLLIDAIKNNRFQVLDSSERRYQLGN